MLYIIALIVTVLGIVFLFVLLRRRTQFGVLLGKRVYEDTKERPGEILSAKTIPLVGKPDYLIQEGEYIIPVEFKSGKTPYSPYLNHTMQLMAYCLLVEEHYGTRPPGGYIRYKDREFKIQYTKEAEESLRNLVKEMLEKKKTGEELFCKHPEHNR